MWVKVAGVGRQGGTQGKFHYWVGEKTICSTPGKKGKNFRLLRPFKACGHCCSKLGTGLTAGLAAKAKKPAKTKKFGEPVRVSLRERRSPRALEVCNRCYLAGLHGRHCPLYTATRPATKEEVMAAVVVQ